uniref:RNA-directed RNA polymerase n=1 Tax=Solanum tuberosum TaxID=4113 RepID=M1DPW5_SOLTU
MPRRPTLGGKALPNKDDSVSKGNRTQVLLVKDDGVLTTPPQPLLIMCPYKDRIRTRYNPRHFKVMTHNALHILWEEKARVEVFQENLENATRAKWNPRVVEHAWYEASSKNVESNIRLGFEILKIVAVLIHIRSYL